MNEVELSLGDVKPGSFVFSGTRTPGYNVDEVNIEAGMEMLTGLGYEDPRTLMVINYSLQLWARGEEASAERKAIDASFHGISVTNWRMVLAHAIAKG